jgi:hypothetical protein
MSFVMMKPNFRALQSHVLLPVPTKDVLASFQHRRRQGSTDIGASSFFDFEKQIERVAQTRDTKIPGCIEETPRVCPDTNTNLR